MAYSYFSEQRVFESAMNALEAEIANAGAYMVIDAEARKMYARQIKAMSAELRGSVAAGKITWAQAAAQAQEARNIIMEVVRSRSSPLGLALAQQLKSQGKTLNELIAKKAVDLYGKNTDFSALSESNKNTVYSEVVKSAGKSNPKVTAAMQKLSSAGRGLIFVSLAISAYNISTADDKWDAAGKEAAVTGAGIGGGIVGGAVAGLACGPGAPICVTAGAFIGGALAAFGVGMAW